MKKVDAISYVLLVLAMIVMVIFVVYKIISGNAVVPVVSYVIGKTMNVKNMTYYVDGKEFHLMHGSASLEISTSSKLRQTVRIFGNPVYGDLNRDQNRKDSAIVLAVSTSSLGGTHYYAVFAIASGTLYKASYAMYLDNNIDIKKVEIRDGNAFYTYIDTILADNKVASSTIEKTIIVHYDSTTGDLGELVADFEGEADTNKMTLSMKRWDWIKTEMNDGGVVTPNKKDTFSITFSKNGTVGIRTDCNSMSGSYSVKGTSLTFNKMMSTLMYCEGSQEQLFAQTLSDINSFLFTSKGELILQIKMDSGVMVFR